MTKKKKLNSKNPKYKSAKELVVKEVKKKVLIGINGVKAYATFYK